MPSKLTDFYREFIDTNSDEILELMSPEKQAKFLKSMPAEKRVEGLSTEELERLLDQRRAAEASAKKKGGKPGRGSAKRGTK